MCLLITGKSDAIRNTLLTTPGLVEDIYAHNPDGLGLMWPENGKVAVVKALPRSVEEITHLLKTIPNPSTPIPVAIHFRMRTHGDIDIDNCHPYQINEHAWLMHNGVLDTGNHKDKSKSDTWHFVQDYLTTMPVDVLHNPQYLALLGYTIGHNTFAIMSDDGRLSEVNRHLGVKVGGLWFSNTYAWDAGILIPEYRSRAFMWGYRGDLDPVGAPSQISYPEDFFDPDSLLQSVEDYNVNDVAYYLERTPEEAIDCILNYYRIEVSKTARKECTKDTLDICEAWANGDETFLSLQAMQDPDKTAEALLYYCNFDYKPFDPLHERNASRGNLLVSWKK